MNFDTLLSTHRGKKIAVCGVGVSNLPLIRLLRSFDLEVEARDRKDAAALGDAGRELDALGVPLISGDGYLDDFDADIIYRSPGIRPDAGGIPAAVARGATLTSEMEAFFSIIGSYRRRTAESEDETELAPTVIAVTGSEGKTTTSTLIAEILRTDGKRVWLGGNIGTPLLDKIPEMRGDDWVVVELSSFQLMTMGGAGTVGPYAAVVTNVTPNHLDYHTGMDEYTEAKKRVYGGDFVTRVVLNADDPTVRAFADEVSPDQTHFFSLEREVESGVFLRDGQLVERDAHGEHLSYPIADIRIPGMHNVANYAAAMTALYGVVKPESITKVMRGFGGVEHRIEFVRELNGVRYYNDSIASSPTRTIAGLKSFSEKVVLIAGGYDKQIPFDPLAVELPAHVSTLVLIGATSDKIEAAARSVDGCPPIVRAESFEQAVHLARDAAGEGGVVLLSPACASFDLFRNFAERGNKFKEIVNSLL